MKIAVITDWFSEKMGYAENCLPKALAALGHEVHVITSNGQVYFNAPMYKATYEQYIGPPIVECGTKALDGYTLHRLPHAMRNGEIQICGLLRLLRALRPDIVQTFDFGSRTTRAAAIAKPWLRYKLFMESHVHASVYHSHQPPKNPGGRIIYHTLFAFWSRWISWISERCYPIAEDCAEIMIRDYHYDKKKIVICSLGVDTDLYHPAGDETSLKARAAYRERLGFADSDVVCIYTGRFSKDKGPHCLAGAVGILAAQGKPYRGLFVGAGSDEDAQFIQSNPGCVIHPFVPARDLPPFYWASDIGVWPRQESTSQLDAAACGLPIIVSNRITVRERYEGNGLTYEENDPADLARKIESLSDAETRRRLGEHGARKMQERFSWLAIARQRIKDYEAALLPM
ncbi:MAG: glycosyltransferase family 4 protein [Candidatus Sumerlaeota bacterium]|nr:glycosyltransferase family 4 protein [Candidatus Sumerlaeota bacterium]